MKVMCVKTVLMIGVAALAASSVLAGDASPAAEGSSAATSTLHVATIEPMPEGATQEQFRKWAHALIRESDKARGNLTGVRWMVDIHSVDHGKTQDMRLDVKARANNVLAVTKKPRKSKGNTILRNRGSMWFFGPKASKPVAISERQKLAGDAAYGDIASTNYADDYLPKQMEDEEVDGEPCWVFDLTATSKKLAYNRVVYYISKARLVGVKGRYFALSGKSIKSARMFFDNRVPGEKGSERAFISRMVITSAVKSGTETTMTFSEPRVTDLPMNTFDLNLVSR